MIRRQIPPAQIFQAKQWLEHGKSVAFVCKQLGVNKPAVLKAIGWWDSDNVDLENGLQVRMKRGKMIITEKPKKGKKKMEVKEQSFQIR